MMLPWLPSCEKPRVERTRNLNVLQLRTRSGPRSIENIPSEWRTSFCFGHGRSPKQQAARLLARGAERPTLLVAWMLCTRNRSAWTPVGHRPLVPSPRSLLRAMLLLLRPVHLPLLLLFHLLRQRPLIQRQFAIWTRMSFSRSWSGTYVASVPCRRTWWTSRPLSLPCWTACPFRSSKGCWSRSMQRRYRMSTCSGRTRPSPSWWRW
mmetsp:Transcript_6663/g.15936  ORF Transcript_6663/g.15936 Transcript_6663/m.15936 type:complete len:207 (-) Transcript_6663:186-806(-)